MRETPFDSELPPDEAWWERELHRNEKLIDKYMAVMDENPDWIHWQRPEDLYNKVHYGIDPPKQRDALAGGEEFAEEDSDSPQNEDDLLSPQDAAMIDAMQAAGGIPENADPRHESPPDNAGYVEIAQRAREFASKVISLGSLPPEMGVLVVSAGKVGANLAGGHALGYSARSLCGNIVKCRWALADCRFCCEMLDQLQSGQGRSDVSGLHQEATQLADGLQARIARLRERVWW